VPQDELQALWFETHLKPHEAMLRSWLQARFSGDHETDDIMQDAFVRVLNVHQATSIASPKAYLFATARNLALARIRHGNLVAQHSLAERDLSAILDEAAGVPDTVAHSEELEILTKAIQSLPTRCRQILTLRKIYGLPQREVAQRMGIAEHTVEAQGTIGIRKIAEFFERYNRKGG
jgi:RNA polymerase sigma factor (sigma-70 family)